MHSLVRVTRFKSTYSNLAAAALLIVISGCCWTSTGGYSDGDGDGGGYNNGSGNGGYNNGGWNNGGYNNGGYNNGGYNNGGNNGGYNNGGNNGGWNNGGGNGSGNNGGNNGGWNNGGGNGSGNNGGWNNGGGNSGGNGNNGGWNNAYCDAENFCTPGGTEAASRDLTTSIAIQEEAALDASAKHYAAKFELSEEQGMRIAKTLRDYSTLQTRSDADVADFAKRLYGIEPTRIVIASAHAQAGNAAPLDRLIQEAAKSFNTTPDNMKGIVKTIHGKLLQQQGIDL